MGTMRSLDGWGGVDACRVRGSEGLRVVLLPTLKWTRPMKIARQKVLFMHAAPSSAASETVIVLRVFFPA